MGLFCSLIIIFIIQVFIRAKNRIKTLSLFLSLSCTHARAHTHTHTYTHTHRQILSFFQLLYIFIYTGIHSELTQNDGFSLSYLHISSSVISVYSYKHAYGCTHTHEWREGMHVWTHATETHKHKHTHTHTHTHTYTHTHTHKSIMNQVCLLPADW